LFPRTDKPHKSVLLENDGQFKLQNLQEPFNFKKKKKAEARGPKPSIIAYMISKSLDFSKDFKIPGFHSISEVANALKSRNF